MFILLKMFSECNIFIISTCFVHIQDVFRLQYDRFWICLNRCVDSIFVLTNCVFRYSSKRDQTQFI